MISIEYVYKLVQVMSNW